MKDIAASVLGRLKNESKSRNIQFQQILMLFAQEELLRRISKSKYRENLVLKGGFLLFSLSDTAFRPTVDADYFLNNFSNKLDDIKILINEIINTKTQNEFIEFEIKGYENIAEQEKYPGIRVNLISKIKNTRTHISIDFAAGDTIVPEIEKRKLATLLVDFEKVDALTYPLETVISEKLHAIVQRMELTSRMKDFYDINYLLKNYSFKGEIIKEAIIKTFSFRSREYDKNTVQNILRLAADKNVLRRWHNFSSNVINKKLDFTEILESIVIFLDPPVQAVVKNQQLNSSWDPKDLKWS